MGIIRKLPIELINRIAAGECIERPASVVKELLENALDAGAGRIDIAISDGGRELIAVRDDGLGMDADDLRLAVEPHATSKIQVDDDLFNIQTLGFRGEALASIGSVARLQITTRRRAQDTALRLRVEGGACGDLVPCAAPPGTLIEVRDLFYCVPARRKFLKTSVTEVGHITEQLARVALAQPAVAFSLRHQNRVLHELPATSDMLRRIGDFYGEDLAAVLLPIRRESDSVLVEGWVAPPAESRGANKWEYVFVNGRYVRDRFVSHAIKEAYRSLIDPHRYPVAFLFIRIAPDQVDVNVHPTKIEIRWRDSNYVHAQVLAALRDKFLRTNLDHSLSTRRAAEEAQQTSVRQAMVDFFARRHDAPPREPYVAPPREPYFAPPAARVESAGGGPEPARSANIARVEPEMVGGSALDDRAVERAALPAPDAEPPPRAIQLHNTYLVVETPDGLMLVDQHALHERILYEELHRRLAQRTLESQRLLLAETFQVPADRLESLETHAETLARLGLELTPSGPQTVTLHAFPLLLERADRGRFVADLLDLLSERGSRPEPDTLLHKLLDMMACKAAVKAGDPLTADEIAALLARREIAERSSHCPHGRPTTLHLTLADLERQFRRR